VSRGREAHRSRREELVTRSAAQRDEIARGVESWKKALNGVDRVVGVLGYASRIAPLLGAGLGLVTLLAARSKSASRWIRDATTAWRSARSVVSFVAGLRG